MHVTTQTDVERARREVRALARSLGFAAPVAESVTLAVVELATNLVRYAQRGELLVTPVENGLQIESTDFGPGIADVDRAMEDGFSTGGGLGAGLGAVRRLMDEITIVTGPEGTRIVARKWLVREC